VATDAATKAAKDLGVDLGSLDGSGAKGRITVKDVRKTQKA
jgi:pyruvate/2-oxoglutarate dehydrogenase complex dihydrolipoamide acyltransferase (E2) component